MSILFDAKNEALGAYPDDREKAINLFINFIQMDVDDIEYELGMTIEKYLFPDNSEIKP